MKIIDEKDTVLPEEEHHAICIIRCSNDNVINIPKRLLKDIRWKINQKVIWSVCELIYKDRKNKFFIEIDRLEDMEKEYYPLDEKENKC